MHSAAYQRGYDDQSSATGKQQDSYAAAYAYCSVMQQSLFHTADATEAGDYVQGCIDYVLIPGASTGLDDASTDSEFQADATSDSFMDELNAAGASSWGEDPYAGASEIDYEKIYLSESDSDGAGCAVWVFPDEATAADSAENGDFDWVDEMWWYGSDANNDKGIVLIATNTYIDCAQDAADVLNWNLE